MDLIKTVPIEEELKRNPELKIEDIEILQEWCKKQSHLPKITNSQLVMFLHSNYFRIEATKTTIDQFYTIRTHFPEIFRNTDPIECKELRQAFKTVTCFPLNMKTKEGYQMFYGKIIDPNPSHYNFYEATKYFCMASEACCAIEGTVNGFVTILDCDLISFGHATRISPMGVKKLIQYVQEGIPIRLKAIHHINIGPALEVIVNMAKPFMKKELFDLLHFHSTNKTLAELVPIEALPNECGGKGGSLMELTETEIKFLEDHRSWFNERENDIVNETLRSGSSKTDGDVFGVEGTFKKLEID